MRWETDCGNPNTPDVWIDGAKHAKHARVQAHPTKKSAQTRLLRHLDEMRQFGRTYNHALEREAEAAIEQVKNTALDHLPIGEWRGWSVRDDYSGVAVVVRVRRTE